VVLVLLAVTAGVAAGYAGRGRLRHLIEIRPQRSRLLLTAIGLAVAGVFTSWLWEPALSVSAALSGLVVAFYAGVNRRHRGAVLVALGLVVNSIVLLANGAVPVSTEAAARAGTDVVTRTFGRPTVPIGDDTRLAPLGRVIPVAFPPRPEVVSPGDIAVAAGLAVIVSTGMTGTSTQRRRRDEHATIGAEHGDDHDREYHDHGQEVAQAQGSQEQVRQPRQAPQRLT
jgi:hypothetical protein